MTVFYKGSLYLVSKFKYIFPEFFKQLVLILLIDIVKYQVLCSNSCFVNCPDPCPKLCSTKVS